MGTQLHATPCNDAAGREQQWQAGSPEAPSAPNPADFLLPATLGPTAWPMSSKMHPNKWGYPYRNSLVLLLAWLVSWLSREVIKAGSVRAGWS